MWIILLSISDTSTNDMQFPIQLTCPYKFPYPSDGVVKVGILCARHVTVHEEAEVMAVALDIADHQQNAVGLASWVLEVYVGLESSRSDALWHCGIQKHTALGGKVAESAHDLSGRKLMILKKR